MFKELRLFLLVASLGLCLGLCRLTAQTSLVSLPEAYAAMGFDPHHPSNSVVVLFSDPHMNLESHVLPITTNVDQRLVDIVNTMDPPPAKIIVSGDTSTTLSPIPGWQPRVWSMNYGTNEMLYWLQSIQAFTNIAQTNILWTPGNHDQIHYETNAETFRLVYPMMPTRQRVDVAGVRFFLLNCGNYGGRNDAQAAWLRDEVAQTSPEQPVVVVTHVPPFLVPPLYRGMGLELREIFGDWPARWWTFSGHYHARSLNVYNVGRSNVASMTVGTANQKNTNGQSHDSGSLFLCLSNGIAGIVYYHYNDASFEVVSRPDWENPREFFAAFENVPGLLWSRLKACDPWPEVTHFEGDDAVEWYAYTQELRWELPLWQHLNQATHFLLLVVSPSATARLEFGADTNSWVQVPLGAPSRFIYRIPIPPRIATQAVAHVRYLGPRLNDFIAGWGLATTNPPPWWPSLSESTLVSTGALWRYHDAGLDLGTAWRLPGHDDATWLVGLAPLGYGRGDEGTVVSFGRDANFKHPTTYFRHVFHLPDHLSALSLSGRILRDGGAVVYFNGTEVFRSNMPTGAIGYATSALSPVDGPDANVFHSFSVPANLFQPGTNALAVAVHQYWTDAASLLQPAAYWSFDEAGPPWHDRFGDHHFQCVGSNVLGVAGKANGGVSNSHSSTSYLTVTSSPEVSYSGPFTVGGWFAFAAGTGDDPASTCLEKADEFRLYYTGTAANRYRFRLGEVEVQDQTSGTASGQWRFVVGWYDGTNAFIQVDIGPVYSAAASPPAATSNPLVALQRAGALGGFSADEVFFFKRVLTAVERDALYVNTRTIDDDDLRFDFELVGILSELPRILSSPTGLSRRVGEDTTFTVNVTSATPIAYQWLFNDVPIFAATNEVLSLANLTTRDAGCYSVVVSNLVGVAVGVVSQLGVFDYPRLSGDWRPDRSGFQLHIPSDPAVLTVLVSTNLVEWTELFTLPAFAGPAKFADSEAIYRPHRFYRLRLD